MSAGATAVFVILGFAFIMVALAICGNLHRIADAVEAQNEHYGIGRPRPTIVNWDETA